MEKQYIIGVDGGGTKTDYLLFTTSGKKVDALRVGTRSHEMLPGGFLEVEETILSDLAMLLNRNSIHNKQIVAAAFGMAGIDTPGQHAKLSAILEKVGFEQCVIANDSVLGIKAGCSSGVGICSINGTGTAVTGINEKGEVLQVGGIGYTTGDSAGGSFIASLALRAVYDYYFRCGAPTCMSEQIMRLFEIHEPIELMNVISEKFYEDRRWDLPILNLLFEAANAEDQVAVGIVRNTALQLAKSVAGCIKALGSPGTPEVILAGSVWVKSNCPLLTDHFKECVYQLCGKKIEPMHLKVIPAAGAVIWALELAQKKQATEEQRRMIIEEVSA